MLTRFRSKQQESERMQEFTNEFPFFGRILPLILLDNLINQKQKIPFFQEMIIVLLLDIIAEPNELVLIGKISKTYILKTNLIR